jgi:hypothetical protein
MSGGGLTVAREQVDEGRRPDILASHTMAETAARHNIDIGQSGFARV